ncbi:MAG: methylmalonyl-CoA mutase family protein [Anaerolineae bacterium]|nr:methylmalonyl-CoA mutase family protein [Anaerolineae bacterium]
MSNPEKILNEKQRWEESIYKKVVNRYPERRPEFNTTSGIPIPPVVTPADVDVDYLEDLGMPGEYPYTRGVQPTMYRGRFWTMRQYAGYASAEESNARYRYLLEQGQTGLSVAFDLPTQLGYDADDDMAMGEVGKVGVSISCLDDMRVLFREIPLDKVSTSMTINAPAAILWAMYIAVAREQGVAPKQLRGTIQNDILKEYVARGTYIFPPRPSMRLITDTFRYGAVEVPKWNPISISGYHIREAGSTAAQEIAFTLANGIAYVDAALDAGLGVDDFAPRLSFFFNAHNDFLEENAKFRAARRMWARIMRTRFGAENPKSWMMRFHTQTAGSTLTAQQPMNNVIRVTLQALAAVLGGTQSLHTNSMDEALWLPTEESVRVALRTQQLIAYESGVADVIDPLAGSYYIEHLTNALEQRANAYIAAIDEMGGAAVAVERGYMQAEIADAAYRAQKAIEISDQVIVGVNKFEIEEQNITLEQLKVDPAIEEEQRKHLAHVRAGRNTARASAILSQIETTAKADGAPLMPLFIEAVEAECTLGEICGVLRKVWGEYQPKVML